MSDITREFLDALEEEFDKRYSSSKKIQSLVKRIKDEKATAEDAFEYAKEVGYLRKLVLHDLITDDVLNDGYLGYYNAKMLFDDVLYKDYELINQYCKNAFTQLNKRAGINLKGVSVDYDQKKTDGITECAVKDRYTVTRSETEEAVSTNAKGYYDSSVEKNARFQYKSGLSPKIIRTAVGKTCKWCQSLAGTYDYYEVSNTGNDVFRRHANCDCMVVYSPRKGEYQDVYSKRRMNDVEYKEARKIREIKLQNLEKERNIKNVPGELEKGYAYQKLDGDVLPHVPVSYLESKDYAKRFNNLPFSKEVKGSVVNACIKAVSDNLGTQYESMYLIDAETGSVISKIEDLKFKKKSMIVYPGYFIDELEKAKNSNRKIISIHNHPNGLPPSIDDFMKAYDNAYEMGIVVGGNGQIYTYRNTDVRINKDECDILHAPISIALLDDSKDVDEVFREVYNEYGLYYNILEVI